MDRMVKANWLVDADTQTYDRIHLITTAQGNIVYAQEFARRYGDKIISFSVHPGLIPTSNWTLYALIDSHTQ